MTATYDVVIYEVSTGRIDRIVGRQLPMVARGRYGESVTVRLQTVLPRLNDRYSVTQVPAGRFAEGDELPREWPVT